MSTESQRNPNLDALRGLAFIAVISVNLIGEFRLPFLKALRNFHTNPGWMNHATDWLVGLFLDQKGFTILTFLFGLSIAMLYERYGPTAVLRRLLFLLVLGVVHLTLIFSGDILTLYALCGLLILPCLGLPRPALWSLLGLAATVRLFWPGMAFPRGLSDTALIELSLANYGHGSWLQVCHFRIQELGCLIGPLLINVAPRTLGMMLLGVLSWSRGGLERLPGLGWPLLLLGLVCTGLEAALLTRGIDPGRFLGDAGIIGLGLGYTGLVLQLGRGNLLVRLFAPLGRVALTTYLTQTLLLGFLFYGYGLGLYAKLNSFQGLCLSMAFLSLQLALARRMGEGPMEKLWRSFWKPAGRALL